MMINCLIVDDEPLAADVIESFVGKMSHLNLVGKANSATDALALLKANKIDVLFLDIQMPEMTGLELLKTLKNPPIVIFTTAYPNYALESYEIDAADYLLKPISFDRFVKAVNKAEERLKTATTEPADTPDYIFVKADGKLVRINIEDICYVEGLKDYVIIHTMNSKVVTHNTMKNIEALLLNDENFIRIHRSYIINLRFVKEIEGNSFRVKDQMLTIGTTFKEDVQAKLEKFRFN